ncbi:MAG TPA: hypothetical protein VFA41_16095 [Ktedonobacteraceae bacterium]|jgi:hypothetical protein|nr:hypothetical protein [Ktedonobacteraceae bacterium]
MDQFTLFTPVQILLAWMLLGLLFAWLVIFTILAVRTPPAHKQRWDDISTPSGSFPVMRLSSMNSISRPQQPGTLAPVGVHMSAESEQAESESRR